MNVERLHAIALELHQELQDGRTPSQLAAVIAALEQMVSQPQQPQFQQQLSEALTSLRVSLSAAASNTFVPSWRQVLEELEIEGLVGTGLLTAVDSVMQQNEITPSVALDELRSYDERLRDLDANLERLTSALDSFHIGSEVLAPGEVELSVLIPRHAVQSELPDLGKEFVKLQRIFAPFLELSTGSRPDLKVRSIASSDFSVFLDLPVPTAAAVAVAVERVVALYKQILEIRALRNQLADQGVPEEATASVADHVNSLMSDGIEQYVAEAVEGVEDEGRRNELRQELSGALKAIANRIDAGYNVDVRTGPMTSDEEDEPESGDNDDDRHLNEIRRVSPELKFIRPGGPPILALPEPDAGGAAQEDPES